MKRLLLFFLIGVLCLPVNAAQRGAISVNNSTLVGNYLKLNCSNDPLTNTLDGAQLDFTGKATLEAGLDLEGTLRIASPEGTYTGAISIETTTGHMVFSLPTALDEFMFHNTASGASGILSIKGADASAGTGILKCYDENDAEYCAVYASGGQGYIKTDGTSPGQLNLQADVKGNVECFDLSDVADDADGKLFVVNRKASEGDNDLFLFINEDRKAIIQSDANLAISSEAGNVEIVGTLDIDGDIYTTAWTDWSASANEVGWSGTPTTNIYYKKLGNMVFVVFRISGTSNSTEAYFTLPETVKNATNLGLRFACQATDSGVALTTPGVAYPTANSTKLSLYKDWSAAAWTATGAKVVAGEVWYEKE